MTTTLSWVTPLIAYTEFSESYQGYTKLTGVFPTMRAEVWRMGGEREVKVSERWREKSHRALKYMVEAYLLTNKYFGLQIYIQNIHEHNLCKCIYIKKIFFTQYILFLI